MVLCRSGVGDGGSGWASICERGAGRLMDEAYELELARGLPLASRVRAQLLGNGRFWEDRTVELASKMELFHKEVSALPEECCIQLLLHGITDKQIYQEEVRSPTYQMNLGTYNLGGVIAYPKSLHTHKKPKCHGSCLKGNANLRWKKMRYIQRQEGRKYQSLEKLRRIDRLPAVHIKPLTFVGHTNSICTHQTTYYFWAYAFKIE